MALGVAPTDAAERVERLRATAGADDDPVVLPPEVGAGHGKQFACLCMDVTNKELKTAVDRGVRLDGAPQAVHDDHDGAVPGQGLHAGLAAPVLAGDGLVLLARPARPPLARRGRRSSWGRSPAGAATRARRRRSTTGTPTPAPRSCGPATGGVRTTTRTPEEEVEAVRNAGGRDRREHAREVPREGARGGRRCSSGSTRTGSPTSPVGRIRYGVMLNDEGVILDDGTVVADRRRRVLRHGHDREHGGARAMDHVVERGLAPRRPRPERDRRVRAR